MDHVAQLHKHSRCRIPFSVTFVKPQVLHFLLDASALLRRRLLASHAPLRLSKSAWRVDVGVADRRIKVKPTRLSRACAITDCVYNNNQQCSFQRPISPIPHFVPRPATARIRCAGPDLRNATHRRPRVGAATSQQCQRPQATTAVRSPRSRPRRPHAPSIRAARAHTQTMARARRSGIALLRGTMQGRRTASMGRTHGTRGARWRGTP